MDIQLGLIWEFIPLVMLLMASAFFSGTETAFFNLDESDLAVLKKSHGDAGLKIIRLLAQPSRLLAALLIGNLLVNTLASVMATSLLIHLWGEKGLILAVPVITILLLLFGEITPKILALQFGQRAALLLRRPISFWILLMSPLVSLIGKFTSLMIRTMPLEGEDLGALSSRELAMATDTAVQDAVLTETEGMFLSRLLSITEMAVREIMTARIDCQLLSIGMTREQILEAARDSGFNRYLVVEEDGGLPVGIFHLKDLLDWQEADRLQAASLREVVFVPETKDVSALMSDLRSGPTHMNCVIDEHGDFVGLVTLEDCLEALTGPWDDESDRTGAEVMPVDDGHWLVAGNADLRSVNSSCGTRFELSHYYVTLAGYVMAELGRIPAVGDSLEADGCLLTVLEMDQHKVQSVRIRIMNGFAGGEVRT